MIRPYDWGDEEPDPLPVELSPLPFCPAHCVPEPCPTCAAYIAAGL